MSSYAPDQSTWTTDQLATYNSQLSGGQPMGGYSPPAQTSYNDQINQIYQSTFGRPAEQAGMDYWANQMQIGGITDLQSAIRAGARNDDVNARNDIAAGGVDTSQTWGNGASLTDPGLHYDAANNTWGQIPKFQQNNPGIAAPTLDPYKKNPYLDEMAQGIQSQMNDNWTRNIAPSLRSGAMTAGGFGGSRQGVVEANGANDMNRSLGQNLTNLYGTDFNNTQNRNLQKYGMDQSYNLGMANNNLGYSNLDSNNAQFGANLGLNTMNAQNAWANNGVSAANSIQNQPINYFNTFANNSNTSGGLGGTGTNTTGSTTNGMTTGLGIGQGVDLLGNYIKTATKPGVPGDYPG